MAKGIPASPHRDETGPAHTAFGVLVLIALTVMFLGATTKELHGTPVFYASLVRELLDSGDPLHIFRGPEAYLLKPPLVLWLSALSCKILGLTHLGATFVSRAAGVVVILLCYAIARRLFDAPTAWVAAFVVATNSTFIQFSTTLRMDSMLMAGTLLALAGWIYREQPWASPALFLGLVVALLAKGPLGFAPVVLIGMHAVVTGTRPRPVIDWRWSALLAVPALWYGYLVALHGLRPLSELGGDAVRASTSVALDFWSSAAQEYALRPLRRYWPWLPFMLAGLALAVYRIGRGETPRARRGSHAWLLCWIGLIVGAAIVKPDHDIRYLYPAIPPLGVLAAVAFVSLTGGRLPRWLLAGATLACVAAWLAVALVGWGQRDTREDIARIRAAVEHASPAYQPIVLGGYPLAPGEPRRQNTERDWAHFYLGVVPAIVAWEDINATTARALPYVLTARSGGYKSRLAALDYRVEAITKEMVMARSR